MCSRDQQPAEAHAVDAASQPLALSLRSNFSWTLAGNTIYATCQWALLALVARLASQADVGRLALGFAVTAPVFMLTGLQLRAVQATDASLDYRFGDYLALRLASIAVAVATVGVVSVGFRRETALVVLAVAAAKVVESIGDVFHGLLQQHEKMDRISVSIIVRGLLSVAALATTLRFGGSLFVGLTAIALAWALALLAYDLRSGALIARSVGEQPLQYLRPRWHVPALKRLALLSLPLGFVMMLVSLNTNIPRYAIERFLGESHLGAFAAVAALLVAGNTVVGALGQSASPRLAKHYAGRDREAFSTLLLRLMAVGAILGFAGLVAAVVAGRWILGVLYGQAYAGHAYLLTWVAFAAAVSYLQSVAGYAVTAARCFGAQAPLLALVSATTLALCMWLVPSMGLVGAVLALAGAGLIHLAGNLLLLSRAMLRASKPHTGPALETT